MLKHRGKILEEVVRKWCDQSGFSITALSKKIGQNPSSTYRQFEKEDLPFYIIQKFGKSMGHDFRVEFPEMEDDMGYAVPGAAEIDSKIYEPITLLQAIQQRDTWKNKYLELMEKYNALLQLKLEEVAGR